ncbi:antiviral reverse transcriptase Drt4 [Aeromonas hydrophila]|uniref:antiviral reverse transcriptase Drt4 n=1 Tax=Aeromonas hydrophila TaxID=644 RepID=UPI0013C36361|nr:antiviral reverse transcriptase Drt4 [Aeromonas hydrophila]
MIDQEFLKESLLRFNYFPLQKNKNEELPNIFNSELFVPSVCDELVSIGLRKGGYDHCNYFTTRFNNVHRQLSIPHPLAYAHLVSHIAINWDKFCHIENNDNSQIRPLKHKDGRIIIMTYDNARERTRRYQDGVRGKKFIVHSDISNFYPSLYTHAIPWALLGIDVAKSNLNEGPENDLDRLQRMMKRNETMGVAIGPGTSNIVSEIILFKVDRVLRQHSFSFYRFIDDYTAFCDTYEQAEQFIRVLSEQLSKFGLLLNIKKTEIKRLPQASADGWVSDIGSRFSQRIKVNEHYCSRMLDYAVGLQLSNPSGSILKYTVKSLINKVDRSGANSLLEYASNLSMHYPVLLPLLDELLPMVRLKRQDKYYRSICEALSQCIVNKNSDGMVWSLYYVLKYYDGDLSDDIALKVLSTKDCLSITMLSLFTQHEEKAIQFSVTIMEKSLFEIDQYWILLYQMYINKKIDNPYKNPVKYYNLSKDRNSVVKEDRAIQLANLDSRSFDILRRNKVTFLNLEKLSLPVKSKPSWIKSILDKISIKLVRKVESHMLG